MFKEPEGLGPAVELRSLEQDDLAVPGDAGTAGTLTAGLGAGLWGDGPVDEEALAAAASLLAETSEVQDETVLAADGWTDASAKEEAQNPEDHGFSQETEAADDAEPSETDLEEEEDGADDNSSATGDEEDEE